MCQRGMAKCAVVAAVLAGCGDNLKIPADAAIDAPHESRYLPWKPGAVWSYKLTDPSGRFPPGINRLTTVIGERDLDGVHAGQRAFLTHSEQLIGSKDVYQTFMGLLDVRYESIFYDASGTMLRTDIDTPFRLKLDESLQHTLPTASWTTTFTEVSIEVGRAPVSSTKTEIWRVISSSEHITVIAGTFDDALHVQRTKGNGSVQDYWYVRDVGKVKETGVEQTEELISFRPGP